MASLKWTECLLYLYLKVILSTETKSWTINVSSVIEGLPGSCVVIPCSFDFPDLGEKTTFSGMWQNSSGQHIYHPNKSKIMQSYQNRTQLVGKLAQKDCSLKINPLKHFDRGPFYFRIEIANLDKFSYKYDTVSILMIEKLGLSLSVKGEVREDQNTLANCSVTYYCPTSPPVFTWNNQGWVTVQHTQLKAAQWVATSTLRFVPSREDNNKHLRCSITYQGGQQEATSLLVVTFAPVIHNASYCISRAKMITCMCIVESNPPSGLQFMLSNRILQATDMKMNTTVTMGILQTEQGPPEFIQCLAYNSMGRANITLSVTSCSSRVPNLYIGIAVGGGVLLVFLQVLGMVMVQRWTSCLSPNRGQTSQLNSNRAVALAENTIKHRKVMRKENRVNKAAYTEEPIYANL